MTNDVKILNNILPKKTNLDMIGVLSESEWGIATDCLPVLQTILHSPTGFSIKSMDKSQILRPGPLVIFAKVVFHSVCEKLNISGNLKRINWNYYYPNLEPRDHIDDDIEGVYSILYNPHTTDGGTEINKKFYPDEMSSAKIFKSSILHRGVAPKKDLARFSLNLTFTTFDNIF